MLLQALLLALWAGYCSFDDQGPQMLRRPLLVGPMVGIILGDLETALVISATLELMWMGLGNMAGYQTPDMIVGTIVGTSFAITSGSEIAAGIALATTVAVLSQQLILMAGMIKQFFAPWSDRLALTGNFYSLLKVEAAGALLQFAVRAIPTFLVIYLGSGVIDQVLAYIPASVLSALNVASRILPAVGLSILMTIIMKNGMWAFLILGFVLNAYLKLDVLPITLIALAFGTFYLWIMQIKDQQQSAPVQAAASVVDDIDGEGEYDL